MGHDPDGVVRRQERRRDDDGNVISVTIVDVPKTDDHPEGVKYAFHYGSPEGETFFRYDNAHGVHERHEGDTVEQIDFPGIKTLYRRFRREVDTYDPTE